jgi:FKBP-type peptidyl-prolyl cis-trans isomerase
MRKRLILLLIIFFTLSLSYSQKKGQKSKSAEGNTSLLKTSMDTINYGYGVILASSFENLEKFDYKLNMDIILQGIKDCMENSASLINIKDIERILTQFHSDCEMKENELRANKVQQISDENLKQGAKFLEDNKRKEGVKVTQSGLQYKILTTGKGRKPGPQDTVLINFSGRTIDGNEIQSTYKNGAPMALPLTEVIDGWNEALLMMTEGSKWEICLPPSLAYGDKGYGPVSPNATLVYDIELIKIVTRK